MNKILGGAMAVGATLALGGAASVARGDVIIQSSHRTVWASAQNHQDPFESDSDGYTSDLAAGPWHMTATASIPRHSVSISHSSVVTPEFVYFAGVGVNATDLLYDVHGGAAFETLFQVTTTIAEPRLVATAHADFGLLGGMSVTIQRLSPSPTSWTWHAGQAEVRLGAFEPGVYRLTADTAEGQIYGSCTGSMTLFLVPEPGVLAIGVLGLIGGARRRR